MGVNIGDNVNNLPNELMSKLIDALRNAHISLL